MATHGYIEIRDERSGHITPFSIYDNKLLHAYHDGYIRDMVRDILMMPLWVYEYISTKHYHKGVKDKIEAASGRGKFNILDGLDHVSSKHYVYQLMIDPDGPDSFDHFFHSWNRLIPLDETYFTFPMLMIGSEPLKYELMDKESEDAMGNIVVRTKNGTRRIAMFEVDWLRNDDEDDTGDIQEEVKLLIEDINNLLKLDENKISYEHGKFFFSVDRIVMDLIYQDKLNKNK